MIAIKHSSCLVAGHLHRNAFHDPRADHIPHSGFPEIMGNPVRKLSRITRFMPRFVVIDNWPPAMVKNKGDNEAGLPLKR